MRILYISLYEPMPVNGLGVRKMRNGFLSDALLNRGHDVTLVIPGFDHSSHTQVYIKKTLINISNQFRVIHIPVPEYQSDVSFARLNSDRKYSSNIKKYLDSLDYTPDLIVTQIPSLRMAYAVAKYAVSKKIKYIIDVRDPWPDIYKRLLKGPLIYLFNLIFYAEINRAKYIFNNSSAIVGVSDSYVKYGLSFLADKHAKKSKYFFIGMQKSFKYALHSDDKKLNVIYCGTFGRNLDVARLISICNRLDSSKIQVHVIGSGEGEETLSKFSSENSILKFYGWKNATEINDISINCDVGLSLYPPGAKNSLTNKYFEYMSYGLYNISSLTNIEAKKLLSKYMVGVTYETDIVSNFVDEINSLCSLKSNNHNLFLTRKVKIMNVFNDNFTVDKIYDEYAEFIESV